MGPACGYGSLRNTAAGGVGAFSEHHGSATEPVGPMGAPSGPEGPGGRDAIGSTDPAVGDGRAKSHDRLLTCNAIRPGVGGHRPKGPGAAGPIGRSAA